MDFTWWQPLGAFVGGLVVGGLGWGKALLDFRAARANLEKARTDLQKAEVELKKVQPAVGAIAQVFKSDYEVEELMVEYLMRDDRSLLCRRHYRRIKVGEEVTEVSIPYFVGAPKGTVSTPVLTASPSPLPGLKLRPGKKNTAERYRANIVIPALAFGHEVGFVIEQQIANAFVMTKEEADQAWAGQDKMEEEYFGLALPVSVGVLIVDLEFPPRLRGKATASPKVFYGESEIVNKEEVTRLKNEGKFEVLPPNRFRLTIKKPAKGHMYALVWDPPPDAEVQTA
jgi:hypothetical protein